MYDNTCKFIAETFPSEMARWLLGQALPLTKLEPSELSAEPIRADAVIFLQGEQLILHLEFQTSPQPDLPFRMADYRLRLSRRYPELMLRQIVVYLRRSNSPLVYQDTFEIPNLTARFEIIRLWEQPPEQFLSSPGLFPFAVLANTANAQGTLQQVAQEIEKIEEVREKRNVAASTAILAGLKLEKETIKTILRSETMRESVIYQDIEEQGAQREAIAFALSLLQHRLGTVNPQLETRVRNLSVEQLQELGKALFDLSSEAEILNWLENRN
jgi:predicted transposase/invertase (TIGR01784 family)